MNKNELRKKYIRFRKNLPLQEFNRRNRQIREQFFDFFDLQNINAIHFFLPIEGNREVDTWGIMKGIKENFPETKIILSRTNVQSMELEHYEFGKDTQLEFNKWGIPEPVDGTPFPVESLDMVLVPLLIFDKNGDRVGYGKGFYDRFLKDCLNGTKKIGLSIVPPIDKIQDTNDFDVKLDYCVTPDQVWEFN